MLAIRPSRILVHRGIATSAVNRDMVNYPHPQQNERSQMAYLDHPNRNLEYVETAQQPFPFSPRFADKDAILNDLRTKAVNNWSTISANDTRKLYNGHFRCPLHYYAIPNDYWKMWFGFWGAQIFIMSFLFRWYMALLELEHPEYCMDEHYINEEIKKELQWNKGPFIGQAHSYNYVEGQWKEKHLIDQFCDLIWIGGWFRYWMPHDVRDGTQLGFTYINK